VSSQHVPLPIVTITTTKSELSLLMQEIIWIFINMLVLQDNMDLISKSFCRL
jgi:hypothetical protein